MRASTRTGAAGLYTFLILVGAACGDIFEPFVPHTPLPYSMFGYLDASADTQWIRVTAVRKSIFTTPDQLDAIVTLEHLGTGETIVLRDSVYVFGPVGLEDGGDTFVHNFWTDVPIEHGATYRLSVTGSNGDSSATDIAMPDEIREVVVESRVTSNVFGSNDLTDPLSSDEDVLIASGLGDLATVRVVHHVSGRMTGGLAVYTDCEPHEIAPMMYSVRQPFRFDLVGVTAEVPLSKVLHANLVEGLRGCPLSEPTIQIATSGAPWPRGPELAVEAPAVTELPSAVKGGLGFVGGVTTITVPFETCLIGPRNLGFWSGGTCRKVYNSESSTLRGTVTDSVCGGPVEGAVVDLSPVPDGSDTQVTVRRAVTDRNGSYEIRALNSGRGHTLKVRHPALWHGGGASVYFPYSHVDTLWFGPADDATTDVLLRRQVICHE